MPSDITGTEVLEEDIDTGRKAFRFIRGPLFANVILADEINRTPPKTQAALLQAMQEHAVTAAGETMQLSEPFFVLATQNPIEQEGTYPSARSPTRPLYLRTVDRLSQRPRGRGHRPRHHQRRPSHRQPSSRCRADRRATTTRAAGARGRSLRPLRRLAGALLPARETPKRRTTSAKWSVGALGRAPPSTWS